MGQEKQKKRKERKWKVKVKTVLSLLNPKTVLKFCFLRIPQLHKLIFCIWITRLQSVHPLDRGYYTVARRYKFYFRVAKQYFMKERSEWVK